MSISAISSSSAYSTDYASSVSSKKKASGDDPMTQAISNLQSTDPTLASKLSDMQKKVDSMKKSDASQKDIQSTVKSTLDGLSSTEKSELESAMPAPPAGRKGVHHGGHHGNPLPVSITSPASSTTSSSGATGFSLTSVLDSSSSMSNDSIMELLSGRASSATDSSAYSVM